MVSMHYELTQYACICAPKLRKMCSQNAEVWCYMTWVLW